MYWNDWNSMLQTCQIENNKIQRPSDILLQFNGFSKKSKKALLFKHFLKLNKVDKMQFRIVKDWGDKNVFSIIPEKFDCWDLIKKVEKSNVTKSKYDFLVEILKRKIHENVITTFDYWKCN